MTWSIVVLWLLGDAFLPTRSGSFLVAVEPFDSEQSCVAAIPRYEQYVLKDFGTPGVVACLPPPDLAGGEVRVAARP